MTQIDEETLIAFADGELTGEAAERAKKAIAADPALQADLERYRALRTTIGQSFAALDEAPLPASLMATLEANAATPHSHKPAPTATPSLWSRLFMGVGSGVGWRPAMVAATLVAVAGIAVLQSGGQGQLEQPLEFASLLDSLVDGSTDGAVKIEESYLRSDGAFCRTYTSTDTGTGTHQRTLACRPEGGAWQLVATEMRVPEGAFLPAGTDGKNNMAVLIAAMQKLATGDEDAFLKQK